MAKSDDFLVGLDDSKPTRNRNKFKKTAAQAHDILPRILIETMIGAQGIATISAQKTLCLVVEAPAADWVVPLWKSINEMGEWDFSICRSVASRGKAQDESTVEGLVKALGAGGRAVAISQSPTAVLPPALISAADMIVSLPAPTAKVIGATIEAVTGRMTENLPPTLATGLTFDEIATCIRQNSTPAECVERLQRASASKRRVEHMGQDVPYVHELHGYGEAQTWAMNLVEDLDAWRRGEISLHDIDRNVVLASAPGLGKTTFARSLARSTGLPLITTSVGAWFANSPGYLDSIIKQIDEVFASARAVAPAILFLDECHGIPSRETISPRGADWWLPVIGHLLTVLDGATSDTSNLVVVGATNYAEKLDPAIVRPGRLNRVITIPAPDSEALEGIFRQHLGDDLAGEDLSQITRLAVGNSGAQVVAWVKAARRTARTAKRCMLLRDLMQAVVPDDNRNPELLHRIAVHEAGHAVVGTSVKLGTVTSLTVIEKGITGGLTRMNSEEWSITLASIERYVCHVLGGRAAEEAVLGSVGSGSGGDARSDLARATQVLGLVHLGIGLGETLRYHGNAEEVPQLLALNPTVAAKVEADLQRLYARALEICRGEIPVIKAVAEELAERRYLDGERYLEIVAETRAGAKSGVISHG